LNAYVSTVRENASECNDMSICGSGS